MTSFVVRLFTAANNVVSENSDELGLRFGLVVVHCGADRPIADVPPMHQLVTPFTDLISSTQSLASLYAAKFAVCLDITRRRDRIY